MTYLIYHCINPYVIFVFHILSLKMNPDFFLRAPRLPRFPRIETFEDLPSLYLLYYHEPPIPYATPTSGIVVADLRILVGLPIHNLPLSICNTAFPLDEIMLVSCVMDWMRANANFWLLWSLSPRASLIVLFSCPPHICPSWPGDNQYAEFLLFFATRPCLNITLTELCSFMCSVLSLY